MSSRAGAGSIYNQKSVVLTTSRNLSQHPAAHLSKRQEGNAPRWQEHLFRTRNYDVSLSEACPNYPIKKTSEWLKTETSRLVIDRNWDMRLFGQEQSNFRNQYVSRRDPRSVGLWTSLPVASRLETATWPTFVRNAASHLQNFSSLGNPFLSRSHDCAGKFSFSFLGSTFDPWFILIFSCLPTMQDRDRLIVFIYNCFRQAGCNI